MSTSTCLVTTNGNSLTFFLRCRFRERPPASFDAIYERATTQRFFVLSRIRSSTDGCPEEHLEITGSTGNIYNVHIARQPTCDCPHSRAGNQCKHVTFVLSRVLRAKYEYVYQLALLSDELREIFRTAPAPVGDQASSGVTNKNRKPIEGDCPICFEEMKEGPGNEKLVWCKAACGQNIHRQCFNTWAKTKRQNAGPSAKVPCPYCRSTFEIDDTEVNLASIKKTGTVGEDGYVNVADQLGISSARDHSSYSRFWSGHSWAYRHGSFR